MPAIVPLLEHRALHHRGWAAWAAWHQRNIPKDMTPGHVRAGPDWTVPSVQTPQLPIIGLVRAALEEVLAPPAQIISRKASVVSERPQRC